MKDTNFTFDTPHTHIYIQIHTDTCRHTDTDMLNVHVGNLRKLVPEVCGSIHSERQSQRKH